MKLLLSLIGIVLLAVGIAIFAYQGFTYTKHETVAQLGNVQVTADTQKTVYFPPIAGGVSIIAGIIVLVIGARRK